MVCDQPESPNEGECLSLRYMLNRNRNMRNRSSPNAGGRCSRFMMSRNRPVGGGGVFKIFDAPESPNEGECLRGGVFGV